MAKYKVIPGGVCAAKGFSASGVHAGFRANPNKLDLAIIKADVRCAAAGVYTTNKAVSYTHLTLPTKLEV